VKTTDARGLADASRLRFMRRDPRVALTVLDARSWYRHISLLGRIVSLEENAELRDIDRFGRRYTGNPFRTRDRRRFSAWIHVDAWHGLGRLAPLAIGLLATRTDDALL
jgi:hypothetical protein